MKIIRSTSFLALLALSVLTGSVIAQPAAISWPDAVGQITGERAKAETCVALLITQRHTGSVGGSGRVVPSTSLLDCLGRGRRIKAKPHAVASRALTRRPRPKGRQLSRRTGED